MDIKRKKSQKRLTTYTNVAQINVFDKQKNSYKEEEIPKKRHVQSPKGKNFDMTSFQRFCYLHRYKQRSSSISNIDQIALLKTDRSLQRQVSPLRFKTSQDEPLMQKKSKGLEINLVDHMNTLMSDFDDCELKTRSKSQMKLKTYEDVRQDTPKFQKLGIKTFAPVQGRQDPILQGIDYRKLNVNKDVSPSKRPKYGWIANHFFKNGFEVFNEPMNKKYSKYQNGQNRSQIKPLLQQTLPPSPISNKIIKDFKGTEIQNVLRDDPKYVPYIKPRHHYDVQRSELNVHRTDDSPTIISYRIQNLEKTLERNNSQNLKYLLNQEYLHNKPRDYQQM